MAARDELVAAVRRRYVEGDRAEKTRILDEFAAITGYHRKHAMRLLQRGSPVRPAGAARPSRRVYDDAVREALVLLWEASDRICGKRLKPLLPMLVESMERHGHIALDDEVRNGLLAMSAATIDRSLRSIREQSGNRRRRPRITPSSVRHSIPVRTHSDWQNPPPGFVEADLVSHSGPSARGSFAQTLVLTDIATGWTECAPLLFRERTLVKAVLTGLRHIMPMDLLGFDTDNDSVFMNKTVRDYCRDAGVEFTRCRPWRKNDQAFVEQKNGAVVRRIVGYRRLEGPDAVAALSELYATVRLFVNFFQPSFKLAGKARDGARVRKCYHPPATPCHPRHPGHALPRLTRSTHGPRRLRSGGGAARFRMRTSPARRRPLHHAAHKCADHCARPGAGPPALLTRPLPALLPDQRGTVLRTAARSRAGAAVAAFDHNGLCNRHCIHAAATAVTGAPSPSASAVTCEQHAITLNSPAFVERVCTTVTCARRPPAPRNMCGGARAAEVTPPAPVRHV